MPKHNIQHLVEEDYLDIWQCMDCGAHAKTAEKIEHHDSCKAGESKQWEEFYANAEEEEDSGEIDFSNLCCECGYGDGEGPDSSCPSYCSVLAERGVI